MSSETEWLFLLVQLVREAEEFPALEGDGNVAVSPEEIVKGAEIEGVAQLHAGVARNFRIWSLPI